MDAVKSSVMWGYTLSDYQRMFELTESDLQKSILEIGGLASSFNAEMHALAHSVVSCDPLYMNSFEKITQEIERGFNESKKWITAHFDQFNPKLYASPKNLFEHQEKAIAQFKKDFLLGSQQERYKSFSLPSLPFPNEKFELALCVQRVMGTEEQIFGIIKELLRVANEVRIFPMVLEGLLLQKQGFGVEVKPVNFELKKGDNALLRVWSQNCELTS